jgi:hypothetical protein
MIPLLHEEREFCGRLHQIQRARVDQVPRFLRQRHMQRDEIRSETYSSLQCLEEIVVVVVTSPV